MSSRAEMVAICKELDIDSEHMSIDEMDNRIRKEVDKRFNKRSKVGIKDMSEELLKFMTLNYDYVIKDKEGTIYKYDRAFKSIKDGGSKS
jgi:hypothetical protein